MTRGQLRKIVGYTWEAERLSGKTVSIFAVLTKRYNISLYTTINEQVRDLA